MRTLYVGLNCKNFDQRKNVYHYPVIKIIPKSFSYLESNLKNLSFFTHLIFTSPRAVKIFYSYLLHFNKLDFARNVLCIAIGKATNDALMKYNFLSIVPKSATQEGIIELLIKMDLDNSNFLIPRSSIARKVLDHFFDENKIDYKILEIYDTQMNIPKKNINLNKFDEVFFTSPSTVRAFIKIFKRFPPGLKLTAIGPITQKEICEYIRIKNSKDK